MAFWQKKKDGFEAMDQLIQKRPGISPAELSRQLKVARSTITRRLPSLNDAGYLYYEDEKGGLWPFSKKIS
jgi:DNA-binding IclR family transcriptional regulator